MGGIKKMGGISVMTQQLVAPFSNSLSGVYIASSIHVCLFLQHAAIFCATWMTSCVQFKLPLISAYIIKMLNLHCSLQLTI